MPTKLRPNRRTILAATAALAAVAVPVALMEHRPTKPPVRLIYVHSGYGGYQQEAQTTGAERVKHAAGTAKDPAADPLRALYAEYSAGAYVKAEASAEQIIAAGPSGAAPKVKRRQDAGAQLILAYSAARQHDLALARSRFAQLETTASGLPGQGVQTSLDRSMPMPTLEQEAAYEHAVCTAALGDKAAAEREYMTYMRRFPQSPFVNAAYHRIELLHQGTAPSAALTVWKHAKQVGLALLQRAGRQSAMCGPECVAELLRRRGESPNVETLADQMGTTSVGTSLASLAEASGKLGMPMQGFQLTQKGLGEQRLPAVALIVPGHFVIVDKVSPVSVEVFDPDANGPGRGAERIIPTVAWQRSWSGDALVQKN